MDFANQISSPQNNSSNFSGQDQSGQSFLGGLLQTVADSALQYGEHQAQQAIDNWTQNL